MRYLKAIIAAVGSGITAALGLSSEGSDLFIVLTVAGAIVTTLGTYLAPNIEPGSGEHAAPPNGEIYP